MVGYVERQPVAMELVIERVLLYGELLYISPYNVTFSSTSDQLLVLFAVPGKCIAQRKSK